MLPDNTSCCTQIRPERAFYASVFRLPLTNLFFLKMFSNLQCGCLVCFCMFSTKGQQVLVLPMNVRAFESNHFYVAVVQF